jgi:hypothetical protein
MSISQHPAATTRREAEQGRPGARPRFRLRGDGYKLALAAHVVSAAGWFGIALFVAFCRLLAAAVNDPSLTRALYRTIEASPRLSVPLGLLAVATGVIMGVGTRYGLVRHWWVVAKIAIAVAVVLADALIIGSAAQRALASGHAPIVLSGVTIGHAVALATAIVLSVFKPRARTPWARPSTR